MKRWIFAGGIAGLLAAVLLVGAWVVPSFAQGPALQEQDGQFPSYGSSIRVDDAQYEGTSEADESAALAGLAKITPEQAKAAALQANPGTTVVKVELDNENGALVYSVELSNGMDVKVDAGSAAVLYTDSDVDNEGVESEGLTTEG
jgi:uncharacterized membrane protein YkoI